MVSSLGPIISFYISSTRNPHVLAAVELHRSKHRKGQNLTIVEGPKLLSEALSTGNVPTVVFTTGHPDEAEQAEMAGARVFTVSPEVLARVSTTTSPQDPVSVMPIPQAKQDLGDKVAVLVDIADPGNVGTLLRSAAAFGLDVIIAGRKAADPWSPKTVRAGAGAQFRTGVTLCRDIADLPGLLGDRTTVATVVSGGQDADTYGWHGRTAVLIGSESNGLPEELIASATTSVCIRLANQVESLNAGTAGSILFHALSLA